MQFNFFLRFVIPNLIQSKKEKKIEKISKTIKVRAKPFTKIIFSITNFSYYGNNSTGIVKAKIRNYSITLPKRKNSTTRNITRIYVSL